MPKVAYAVEVPVDWAAYSVMPGVNDTLPFIYEFHIEGVGSYIGETGNPKRAKRHYRRKVRMLLNDKPVRHRRVHRALAEAHRRRLKITLTILENVMDQAARRRREDQLVDERGATLND